MYDFDDDTVDGALLRPDGEYIRSSRRPSGPSLEKLRKGPPPLRGKMAQIDSLIRAGRVEQAVVDALRWRAEQPGNIMALVALGVALEAWGKPNLAARVYGSIIDLFPSRADMRRFAGERLESVGEVGRDLAADTYKAAVKQRPDHPSGHRLLAFALVRQGKLDAGLSTLEAGLTRRYRIDRPGIRAILLEDLGLVAAAMVAHKPNRRAELMRRLAKHGARIARQPSLRFTLTWETDANDVDLHVQDGYGHHAYHGYRSLQSGGTLAADVRNGYGPECFAIAGKARAFPYRLEAHYYSRGPMGYGMGKVEILQHDGKGGLKFVDRAFVVMNDKAMVDIGLIKGPLQ